MNSSRSQNQTCTTCCSTDDRTGKHSAKSLRTDAQWTTVNIYVGRVEKRNSSFWCLPSSSFCHRRMRKTYLKLILHNPSSWPRNKTEKKRAEKIIPRWWYHLRRPKIKVSMSSKRWGCWRHSCRLHLQQSRHRENDFTLPSRRRRRGGGGNKFPKPRNLAWRDITLKTRSIRKTY